MKIPGSDLELILPKMGEKDGLDPLFDSRLVMPAFKVGALAGWYSRFLKMRDRRYTLFLFLFKIYVVCLFEVVEGVSPFLSSLEFLVLCHCHIPSKIHR